MIIEKCRNIKLKNKQTKENLTRKKKKKKKEQTFKQIKKHFFV